MNFSADLVTDLRTRLPRWKADPVQFVREQFQVEPDAWQADTLRSFASSESIHRRIAMPAAAGPGKSTVLSWCGLNFLACYAEPGEHPNGVAMSCTADNLRDGLWKEFAKWYGRSRYLQTILVWTKERLFARDHPETWFLSARSFSKTADAEEQGRTLSGLHAKYILYLIDESGDINPAVLNAAEQGLSNCTWGKILQAGNPTSHHGTLYQAVVTQRHQWTVVRITGDPDDPRRSPRIDLEWAKEQITLHGRDDPWVMAYILGQFPPSSINALLGPDEVQVAMERHLQVDEYGFAQRRLGVDVARFGDDATVLFPRQGLASFRYLEMRNAKTPAIAARVAYAKERFQSEVEFIDDTGGYGAGVIDALELAGHSPMGVNFSGKAADPRYFNLRSEMWFRMAEWVKKGGALPPIPALARELTAPTYVFHQGKFRLEEKDQIKKRLGFSPDASDALCLTFCLPELPSHEAPAFMQPTEAGILREWNPLDEKYQ